jgi:hypothetical protein
MTAQHHSDWNFGKEKLPRHSRESGNPVDLNKRHFFLAGFPPTRE